MRTGPTVGLLVVAAFAAACTLGSGPGTSGPGRSAPSGSPTRISGSAFSTTLALPKTPIGGTVTLGGARLTATDAALGRGLDAPAVTVTIEISNTGGAPVQTMLMPALSCSSGDGTAPGSPLLQLGTLAPGATVTRNVTVEWPTGHRRCEGSLSVGVTALDPVPRMGSWTLPDSLRDAGNAALTGG
ncbi:hypothetical protein [Kitasatospora sp. NPDC002040]|uniref:hypothetical protein n=1 Tax=Kitasatospora sp. NPDC002040 TaxID=3154661 RepID=UPI0033318984